MASEMRSEASSRGVTSPEVTGAGARPGGRARWVLVAVLAVSTVLVSVVPAASAAAQDDDGDLRERVAAACARVPVASERVDAAIARLDGPVTQRGSLAWFEAAVQRATDNGRPRVAADLQRRLDRLIDRRAVLDVRVSQLDRFAARCAALGLPA